LSGSLAYSIAIHSSSTVYFQLSKIIYTSSSDIKIYRYIINFPTYSSTTLEEGLFRSGYLYFAGMLREFKGMSGITVPLANDAGYIMRVPYSDNTLY
jgi:hypothetical protein